MSVKMNRDSMSKFDSELKLNRDMNSFSSADKNPQLADAYSERQMIKIFFTKPKATF